MANRVINQETEYNNTVNQQQAITVFYANQYTSTYKRVEKIIKNIITRNCTPKSSNKIIKVNIYYKNPTTASKIMRNNLASDRDALKEANEVYQYKCHNEDCEPYNVCYVGQTRCTLSRRLTYHLQEGAIQDHHRRFHNSSISRQQLVNNTEILFRNNSSKHLSVIEAVCIRELTPVTNTQMNTVSTVALFDTAVVNPRRDGGGVGRGGRVGAGCVGCCWWCGGC